MKQTFTKVLFLVFTISAFSGCAATSSNSLSLSKYDLKEISSEKQVLVYDKTISLPTSSYVSNMQFSPINQDELVISLLDKQEYSTSETDHFMVIDLKNEKLKKDIKLETTYSSNFTLSDDGKKLYLSGINEKILKNICKTNIKLDKDSQKSTIEKNCQDTYVNQASRDKFAILDLQTGTVSPTYSYNCDSLIPKELKKDGVEAYCSVYVKKPINFAKYNYIDKVNKKSGQGITIYDKDSFKPKKIITADNKLDTDFEIELISEDGQYVLFEGRYGQGMVLNSDGKVEKRKYVVYDLKNDKITHSFDTPFTIWGGVHSL